MARRSTFTSSRRSSPSRAAGRASRTGGWPRSPRTAGRRRRGASWSATRGAEAPAAVKGHYAFAAIDLRERRVTLATDRFATFPLCYGRSGSRFAFADRADSVPLGSAETVDPQAIFDYLYFHVIPAPRTVFKGVHRLEGGHAVVAERRARAPVRYWTPRFTATPSPGSRRARGGVPRARPAGGRARSGCRFGGLLPERRDGQLDGRRHARRGDATPGADVLDRLRRRGLRRDGVRPDRGASLRDASTASTISRRRSWSATSRLSRHTTISPSGIPRRCRRTSARASRARTA